MRRSVPAIARTCGGARMTARRPDATMAAMLARAAATLAFLCCLPAAGARPDAIVIPPGIATHSDGRAPIESLYHASIGLVGQGWTAEVIASSEPPGTSAGLPIVALRSPKNGPAIWILAGIHGEEPAGPNAVAEAIADIARARRAPSRRAAAAPQPARLRAELALPQRRRVLRGSRRTQRRRFLAPAAVRRRSGARARECPVEPGSALRSRPGSCAEQADYPTVISLDLHEDNLIDEGYVYSQGVAGAEDELAISAVAVLHESGVPIKAGGTTRFDEPIARGIIGPVSDSSIDELLGAREVIVDGERRRGPGAQTVLVLETPAAALPLERRVAAHSALLRALATRLLANDGGY